MTSTTDGVNFSSAHATLGLAPTQSALVVLNGKIVAMDGPDNSSAGVFTSNLDNNGDVISSTIHQVPGWYTQRGISAVVYNNNIVAAFQQDASSHYFYIFSSPDGANWYGQEYPNRENFTPKLALFGSGVSAATVANDSSYSLWTDYAPY